MKILNSLFEQETIYELGRTKKICKEREGKMWFWTPLKHKGQAF